MKNSSSIKTSSDLIGKKVKISFRDSDTITVVIKVMETDGILVEYYTEEDDSGSTCDKDDEGAVLTTTYIPWSSLCFIDYREDEEYP
jgi:TRAP-type uncharacterized transport system substrate-binding protein